MIVEFRHVPGEHGAVRWAKPVSFQVPRGTLHWFNLCADRRIRAIRLFQDKGGWTPHYTDSRVDERYLPVCFGLSHMPATTLERSMTP